MKFVTVLFAVFFLIGCLDKDHGSTELSEPAPRTVAGSTDSGAAAPPLPARPQAAGHETGNGGGGIRRDGKYLTFGSARVEISNEIKSLESLNIAQTAILQMALEERHTGRLLDALVPTETRKYFAVTNEKLSDDLIDQLSAEYRKVLDESGNTSEQEVLYAVTIQKETYLLPSFFELGDDIQRAAILFHEAIWVLDNTLSYREVIEAEITFEKWARSDRKYQHEIYIALAALLKDPSIDIVAAARADLDDDFDDNLQLLMPQHFAKDPVGLKGYYYRMAYEQPGRRVWGALLRNVDSIRYPEGFFSAYGRYPRDYIKCFAGGTLILARTVLKEQGQYQFEGLGQIGEYGDLFTFSVEIHPKDPSDQN